MSKQGQLASCDVIRETIKGSYMQKNSLFIASVLKIPPSLVALL